MLFMTQSRSVSTHPKAGKKVENNMVFRFKISLFKENQQPIITGYSELHFI